MVRRAREVHDRCSDELLEAVMDNAYWSVENASWTSTAGALVSPWSDTEIRLRRLAAPRDAAAVMRLPSRRAVAEGAVPQPREQAEQPVRP